VTTSPLYALCATRLKEFLRERGAFFWTFGFPLLATLALGSAFRDRGPPTFPIAVVDGLQAEATRQALTSAAGLNVAVVPAAEANRRLRSGEFLLTVTASEQRPGQVVYGLDPTRVEAVAARALADDALQRQAGRVDLLISREETAVVRGARYVDWLLPGLLGLILLNGALWGPPQNIVEARKRKLLKRLAATPMQRSHYLLSFRAPGLLFVPLQVLVLFTFARFTFGVEVQGSMLAVIAIALLGSWSFAGLGLLCASRAENPETASGLANLVTLPMFVFSGVFFSGTRFPAVLQPVIHLLPLTAFNDALREVTNNGSSLLTLGYPLGVLVVWGFLTTAISLRLFRWT
jgi:ABC-2 type transport system permease protein